MPPKRRCAKLLGRNDLTVQTAVRTALLNNRRLQASYKGVALGPLGQHQASPSGVLLTCALLTG